MATAASSSSATVPSSSSDGAKPLLAFDFTKRKRWADLLVGELSDAISLLLLPTGQVLYCGPAVHELLGWKDSEVVDCDLFDFVADDDREAFQNSMNESMRTRAGLFAYARLKCPQEVATAPGYQLHAQQAQYPPREVLFEFTGRPHFVSDEPHCRCFFAVAKPYPSRNTTMLNSFLELKLENERLQQRLKELQDASSTVSSNVPNVPLYSSSLVPSHGMNQSGWMYDQSNPQMRYGQSSYAASAPGVGMQMPISSNNEHKVDLDEQTRKKLKKVHPGDQHVCATCGRTDSPEWRKGPLGPKTLCNACGLRWAKSQRKTDDPPGPGGSGGNGKGGSS